MTAALRFFAFPAVALALGLASMPVLAGEAAASSKGQARPGNSYEFQFKGNPSTGYKWRYNSGKSENPGVVRVDDLGYGTATSRMMGAPAPYFFRVTCLKAGQAELWFAYVGPTGVPGEEHQHWARCE